MIPTAIGGGGMCSNNLSRHYRLTEPADVEDGRPKEGSDRICGMTAARADVVINLSLVALCIWLFAPER